MKINSRKLKKLLMALVADMDAADASLRGLGIAIGTDAKYTISVSVERYDPDESISAEYNCVSLGDTT